MTLSNQLDSLPPFALKWVWESLFLQRSRVENGLSFKFELSYSNEYEYPLSKAEHIKYIVTYSQVLMCDYHVKRGKNKFQNKYQTIEMFFFLIL